MLCSDDYGVGVLFKSNKYILFQFTSSVWKAPAKSSRGTVSQLSRKWHHDARRCMVAWSILLKEIVFICFRSLPAGVPTGSRTLFDRILQLSYRYIGGRVDREWSHSWRNQGQPCDKVSALSTGPLPPVQTLLCDHTKRLICCVLFRHGKLSSMGLNQW